MPRIEPKKNWEYPWYLRLLFFYQKKKYGAVYEPLLLWGRTPRVMRNFLNMFRALNRKNSPIDPQLRALVCVKVSQVNSCSFCIDMISALFLKRGGGQDKLNELNNFHLSRIFNPKEKVALRYADAVTRSDMQVDDALFQELKSHFSDDAIVELTALIAFQNMSSKFNAALDAAAFDFCNVIK